MRAHFSEQGRASGTMRLCFRLALLSILTLLATLDAPAQFLEPVQTLVDGQGGVDGLLFARAVVVSPDGAHVYVAAQFDAAVSVFSRDPSTGVLAFVEAIFDGQGGVNGLAGASCVTVSPDGANVYLTSIGDHAIAAFARDSDTGKLDFVEVEVDGQGGVDGLQGGRSWIQVLLWVRCSQLHTTHPTLFGTTPSRSPG